MVEPPKQPLPTGGARPSVRVFLSHSSPDKELARRLARDLQSANVEVWLDQWQIGVGESFEQRIEQGLAETDFVIVLLTRHSVASQWVHREWREKVKHEADTRRISVLPVRADNCELPDFLAQRSHADITGGSYLLGFRHLLQLLSYHANDARILLADDAQVEEARRRQAHLLEIERRQLGLSEPLQSLQIMLPVVTPIALEIAQDLIPLVEPDVHGRSRAIDELAPAVRGSLRAHYGFDFPGIRIRGNTSDLPDGCALVMIDEVPEKMFRIDPAAIVVAATAAELAALGVAAAEFADDQASTLSSVAAGDRAAIEANGLKCMDAAEYLFHAVHGVVRRFPAAFFDLDTLHRLAQELATEDSELVSQVVPAHVSWIDLCSVLHGLLEEDVGVGNLRAILAALVRRDHARHRLADCIEMARQALRAQITAGVLGGAASLRVLMPVPQLEAQIGGAPSRTASGPAPTVTPEAAQAVLSAVRRHMHALGGAAVGATLLVEDARIRALLRRLVKIEFPKLPVLSRLEVEPGTPLEVVGEIALADADARGE